MEKSKMMNSNIKIAFRILIRNRRFSIINLAGLTIGLAGFIMIMSWVREEVSYDRFHEKRNQIFQLTIKHPDGILDPNTPYALAPILAKQYPEIESFSLFMRMESRINCSFIFNADSLDMIKAYEPAVARVDTGFFEIFDFPILYGDKNSFLMRPDAVVISSEIANVYFPDINPVGRTIIINNSDILTISGVVDIPGNTFFQFDFFLPIFEDLSGNWNWNDPAYLLLNPGIDLESFKNKIASSLNDNYPFPFPEQEIVSILPIHKTHLTFGGKWKVFLFSCVALLLLSVASLNYINLASANYTKRIRETGIRKVMGARKRQLMINFFIETYILAFGALILALFLSELILPAMTPLFGKRIEIGYLDQPLVLLILLFCVGLIGSLVSVYPYVLFSQGNPVDILHRSFHPGSKRSAVIVITTVFQFTLSLALMISTLIVIKQVRFATKADLGFSVENVVSIPMNQGIGNNFQGFLDRMESHPNISIVSAGQAPPYNEDYKTNIDWSTKESETMGLCRYSICLNNYLDLFDMQIVNGRGYSDDFGADMDKYIINEKAASMLGFDDPVGKPLTMWNRTGEIIGVVKDYHHVSLHREILPHVFNIHPSNFSGLRYIFIKLGPGNKQDILSYIETTCQDLAPEFPFSYSFLEDEIGQLYATDKNLSRILGIFSLLILIVSSLGIYGLAYYSVDKKTKEITIRKVFGATLGNILSLIYKSLLSRMGISLILAIALSLFVMTKWLQNFAFKVKPDLLSIILPAILALLVAGISTIIAMWNSVRQNPAELLNKE